jgi:uncharacterized protein (TIGR00730 family)
MGALSAVSVFCGSSMGTSRSHAEAAHSLGQLLGEREIELVYGGASVGLMGVVADATLAAGGRVTGVITEALSGHEIAHSSLTTLHIVHTMHERKALMAEHSDAVIMLPGGFGTLEEFFESVTWLQLGIHGSPGAILNVEGFFDGLLAFVNRARDMGFVKPHQLAGITVAEDPAVLLDRLAAALTLAE